MKIQPSKGKDYWLKEFYKGINVKEFEKRRIIFDKNHWLLLFSVIILFIICVLFSQKISKLEEEYKILKQSSVVKSDFENIYTQFKILGSKNERLSNKIKELESIDKRSESDIISYILNTNKKTPVIVAAEIAKMVIKKSEENNIPFVATLAVIEVESYFNPYAVSNLKKDPARGLMQVRPGVWLEKLGLKNKNELHDIEKGIDAGCKILRTYLDETNDNMKKALYKYVGGNEEYGEKVYESMGKFVVYRAFQND